MVVRVTGSPALVASQINHTTSILLAAVEIMKIVLLLVDIAGADLSRWLFLVQGNPSSPIGKKG
jgi:hypothetical protein